MRTRDPTYLSVGFGAFFAIIWIYRNDKLLRGLWVQKWRNKDKLRRNKVHRNVRVLSLKRRRVFVSYHLTNGRNRNVARDRLQARKLLTSRPHPTLIFPSISAFAGAELIKPRLLLVCQQSVERIELRLDHLDRFQRSPEALFHRSNAPRRSQDPVPGAIRLEKIGGFRRCVIERSRAQRAVRRWA